MTWVRYDDNVANHPKVAPLDDATYRLWREAIEWCAQNLTDGVIRTNRLPVVSIRANTSRARLLVKVVLWHTAGTACLSAKCPPSGEDGWVIHDYWDYQPTRAAVQADLKARAERTRRWREAKKNGGHPRDGTGDASRDAYGDGRGDAGSASSPPRPAPKGRGGSTTHQRQPAAHGGEAAAGVDALNAGPVWADSPCPHGQPGGWRLVQASGEPLCPLCRAELETIAAPDPEGTAA